MMVGMQRVARPKPSHHSAAYGAWFQDPLVVSAYHRRPPYPETAIRRVVSLAAGGDAAAGAPTGTVLDLGCGTGDVARRQAW